jgi:anti-sigma regulatory factor (Ser/Thr protein kinase)
MARVNRDGSASRSQRGDATIESLPRRDEGPPPTLTLTLDQSTSAPAVARHAVRRWLAAWHVSDSLLDDVTLVVSELVTNAVLYAAPPLTVVAAARDDQLRLEVHDRSPRPPRRRSASQEVGGFGLQFVAALADDWGWTATSSGKVVWTEHRVAAPLVPRARRSGRLDGR